MSEQSGVPNDAADNMVTVGAFPDPSTAQLARTALEAAGIPVFVQGENANGLIPVAFFARVQVRAQDEAAAREVMEASELNPASFEEVTEAELADEAGDAGVE